MDSPGELMDRITKTQNSSCFLAEFSSLNNAVTAIKQVSFAEADSHGISLPSSVLCEAFKKSDGTVDVIIGGALSGQQRSEITRSSLINTRASISAWHEAKS